MLTIFNPLSLIAGNQPYDWVHEISLFKDDAATSLGHRSGAHSTSNDVMLACLLTWIKQTPPFVRRRRPDTPSAALAGGSPIWFSNVPASVPSAARRRWRAPIAGRTPAHWLPAAWAPPSRQQRRSRPQYQPAPAQGLAHASGPAASLRRAGGLATMERSRRWARDPSRILWRR